MVQHSISDCFENCAGNLGALPIKYKKWRIKVDYLNDWKFIKDRFFRERISEAEMTFDYLISLDEWLSPLSIFKTNHLLICIQVTMAIVETALFDYMTLQIKGSDLVEIISKNISNPEMFNLLFKRGVLNTKQRKMLKDLNEDRNLIHLKKRSPGNLHLYILKKYNTHALREFLNNFKTHLSKHFP